MAAAAAEAQVLFEAAPGRPRPEDEAAGRGRAGNQPAAPWVFTNTSSIPIAEIDQQARLGGRIMGFHFYNPPAVQKLVELIRATSTPA